MSKGDKQAFDAWNEYFSKVIERVGWLGAGLVLLGYYLNAHQFLSSWLIWVIGNLLIAGYSVYKKAWPTALMSLLIALFNVYGYFKWHENV